MAIVSKIAVDYTDNIVPIHTHESQALIPSFPHSLIPLFLNLTPSFCPIQPTPRILARFLPPGLPRQLSSRPTPHPRLTIEHNLFLLPRSLKAKSIFKFLRRDKKRVWLRRYRDIDCGGNTSSMFQFCRLARVDEDT